MAKGKISARFGGMRNENTGWFVAWMLKGEEELYFIIVLRLAVFLYGLSQWSPSPRSLPPTQLSLPLSPLVACPVCPIAHSVNLSLGSHRSQLSPSVYSLASQLVWETTSPRFGFCFTFLDPVQSSALIRSSDKTYRMNLHSDTLLFCMLWLHFPKICFICKTRMLHWPRLRVSPFALPRPLALGMMERAWTLGSGNGGWDRTRAACLCTGCRCRGKAKRSRSAPSLPQAGLRSLRGVLRRCRLRALRSAAHRLASKSQLLTLMWIIVPLWVE